MKQIIFTLCFLFLSSFLFGQAKKVTDINVESSKVVFLGKSKAITDLVAKEATSPLKKAKFKKDKKVPDNFRTRGSKHEVAIPALEHQGVDPVWQSSFSRSLSNNEPLVNIDGLASNFGSPHDPTLAVGIDYVLQSINATQVGVWDKEGNTVTQFSMNTLWTEFGVSSEGDPIILFDQEASRWMLTEFTDPANLLIAISETSDPLGSYFAYTFSTPNFPDYPKYGIWTDHYVVTSNEGGAGTLTQYFIERESLLNGTEARMQRVSVNGTNGSEQGFITSTPIDWEGQTRPVDPRPIVVKLNDSSWGGIAEDAVEMYRFDINYDDESQTQVESLSIFTTPYDSYPCDAVGFGFACISQPNGAGLDGLPEIVMHAPQYRNFNTHESIVLSFVTDVTDGMNHAGARWMELRKTGTEDWSVYQEGSYAPDEHNRYLSGIAIDKNGNIGMGYNISSEDVFAGIRYTGRFANDPLGEMTIDEVSVIEGNSTLNTGGRFADYSHIAVDPVDEKTFWFTSEYASNGISRTRIVAFQLQLDSFDMAANLIVNPESSSDLTSAEAVEFEVRNAGLMEIGAYDISLSVNGSNIETISISEAIQPGETKRHIFPSTIDMSAIGDYNLLAAVNLTDDQNPNNNSIEKLVQQLTPVDATLQVSGPSAVCDTETTINLTIANAGGLPLTSGTIDFYIDGTLVETENWTGNLNFGDTESFDYLLTNIPAGKSTYEIILSPENGEDLIPDNNTVTYEVNSLGQEGMVTLILNTDTYPQETSWFIYEDGSEDPIYSGGDYEADLQATYTEEICLDPGSCYTFEMTDSYGDGICCNYGEGSYGLYNVDGAPIFTSTGEFGTEEVIQFCAGDIECSIQVSAEVQDVAIDGTLGSIMVTPSGGVAPYTYSIDGGMNLQESNIFDNLEVGDYIITVYDATGVCLAEISATVTMLSSLGNELNNELIIKSTPNPNDGFFDLSIENYNSIETFIHFNIYDAQGKLIQSRRMANYSGVYKTQVSLLEYPSGTYFIRFLDEDINQLVKIIKL